MTIEMTLGIGGDVVNLNALWTYMVGIAPWPDNYTFYQISNTFDNIWNFNWCDFNNHFLKIICPYNDCHQGSFGQGFVCEVDNITIQMRANAFMGDNPLELLWLENIRFKKLDNNNRNMLYLGQASNGAQSVKINKCLFEGTNWAHSRAIRLSKTIDYYYVNDCKFYNFSWGLNPVFIGISGTPKVCEGCVADLCGTGFSFENAGWQIKNTYVINNINPGFDGCGANDIFTNCADDDGSLLTCGGTLVDCLPPPPITPANEFQSLNIADANYLKLIDGTRRWV